MRNLEHNGQIRLDSEKKKASDTTAAFDVIERATLLQRAGINFHRQPQAVGDTQHVVLVNFCF